MLIKVEYISILLLFTIQYSHGLESYASLSDEDLTGSGDVFSTDLSSGSGSLGSFKSVILNEDKDLDHAKSGMLNDHISSKSHTFMKISFLLVGFSSLYPFMLLIKNNILQERYSSTEYAQTYLNIITSIFNGALLIGCFVYVILGESIKIYNGYICTWSLIGQALLWGIISVISVFPISDNIFGILIMICSAISGLLMSLIFSSSMAIAAYFPEFCSQYQIAGQRLSDLVSSIAFIISTIIIPDTKQSVGDSSKKIANFFYFFSGSIIFIISALVWHFVLLRTDFYSQILVPKMRQHIGSSLSLVKEIFTKREYLIYPFGVFLSTISIGSIYPFFASIVASSSNNTDIFHTNMFSPFAFLICGLASSLASIILPSISWVQSISFRTIFCILILDLLILDPLMCLTNVKHIDPITGKSVYPSAPRLIKYDSVYFILTISTQIIFGLSSVLFFMKSKRIPDRLKDTMSAICTFGYNAGFELGSLISLVISRFFVS